MNGHDPDPAGTAGRGIASKRDHPYPGEAPPIVPQWEGSLEALVGELRVLRRTVEKQDRRLAVIEEENLRLRRKLGTPLSRRSTFQGLWTARAVNEQLLTRSRRAAASKRLRDGNGQ